MRKEMLRSLRALNVTPAIAIRANRDIPVYQMVKRSWEREAHEELKILHTHAFYLRCQYLGGIIKVAVFVPYMIQQGITEPLFEIFLNIDGEEYITRYYDGDKERWSTSFIENLECIDTFRDKAMDEKERKRCYSYMYKCSNEAWINPEGSKSIKRLLKTTRHNVFRNISEWQHRVKNKKRDQKDAKVFKAWDDDLKLFPQLPRRFIKWAFKENTDHYIFYNAGANKGYCTYCEKEVNITGARHKKDGICPKCKKSITYIAMGKKSKYLQTDPAYSQIIHPIKDGYTIQIIQTQRVYHDYYRKPLPITEPQPRWNVCAKILVMNNRTVGYAKGLYKNRVFRWMPDRWAVLHSTYMGRVYKGTYNEIAKCFPHSALSLIVKNQLDIPLIRYIEREKEYPVLESLIKIGLYDIVKDSLQEMPLERYKHKEAAKALEIDNNRLKKLIELGGSVIALEWLRQEKRQNTVYDPDMIRYYARNDIMEYQLTFIMDRMSYTKIYHYLMKQEEVTGETASKLLITWRDYLNMAKKNKMQTNLEQIYKPVDLKKAHAEQIELANRAEIKKEAATIRRRFKKVEANLKEIVKYEYHAGGYAIVAPKSVEDIVMEGRVLKHCIHRCDFYFERINTKESFIMFLRKENSPGTPWYTLEVEPGGNIRQKRTTGDNQNADLNAAIPFLKKWQAHVKKIMSEDDKKLAATADRKRKENYKNIRINKKLVWHGKHQGELLADVLEADFMAAI